MLGPFRTTCYRQSQEAFDEGGNLVGEDHKERLAKLVKSVLDTTKIFSVGVIFVQASIEDEFGGTYILIEPGLFSMGDLVGDGLARNYQPIKSKLNDHFLLAKDL